MLTTDPAKKTDTQVVKRPRGRPRKYRKDVPECCDIEKTQNEGKDNTKEEMEREYNNNKQPELPLLERNEPVVCGVCEKYCESHDQFDLHAMEIHNGLARKAGEDQNFDETEEFLALRKTFETLKKLRCLKNNCGKNFISLAGFRYHSGICQNKVYENCSICGKKLRKSKMESHINVVHKTKEKEEISGKRHAAKRAREKLLDIIQTNGEDGDDEKPRKKMKLDENYEPDKDELAENDLKDYTKPTDLIPETLMEEWKKEFEVNKTTTCTNPNCQEMFSNIDDLRTHFLMCPNSKLNLCYVCSSCGKKCTTQNEIEDHVEKHFPIRKNGEGGQRKFKSKSVLAAKEAFDFCTKNYTNELFLHWLPRENWWIPLPADKQDIYLPREKESISFKTVDLSKKDTSSASWSRLHRFKPNMKSGNSSTDHCTVFVGGPVWSLAWCPTPLKEKSCQYLALSTHHGMEDRTLISTAFSKDGLIQVWRVTNDRKLECDFALGIAHNFGVVWDLKWCPSGCWDSDTRKNENVLPRIGLLAAACSDGKIYIFSVPKINCLPKTNELPIYTTTPSVILQSEPILNNNNSITNHQCVSLSWLRYKGHSKIAGGFTNGFVALWDITLKSNLIYRETSKGESVFSPYQLFQAHSICVHDVAWAPFSDGLYLTTAGADRQVLFWSTDNLLWPINVYKSSRLLKVAWSNYRTGVFASADDCYNVFHNSLVYIENEQFNVNSRSLIPHNGCIWDLSINDWLNCTASCDMNGEVVGVRLPKRVNSISVKKKLSTDRFPIYRVSISELDKNCVHVDGGIDLTKDENNDENKDDNDDRNYVEDNLDDSQPFDFDSQLRETKSEKSKRNNIPETYENAASNFGIIFYDSVVTSPHIIPKRETKRLQSATSMTSTNLDMFPITSINRISWNPNLGSHLLLASGGQSGLLRIHKVKWLNDSTIDKL